MSGRKQKKRELKQSTYIVGEGITELYYFKHMKKIYGLSYVVKSSFCRNTSIDEIEKKVENLLQADVSIICVFDMDVTLVDDVEKRKIEDFKNKYRTKENVTICDSLQSIEYWFLIHYDDTNKLFNSSKILEEELTKHIVGYEKKEKFLETEKWVKELCSNGRLEKAIQRAKTNNKNNLSYSNIYKVFESIR